MTEITEFRIRSLANRLRGGEAKLQGKGLYDLDDSVAYWIVLDKTTKITWHVPCDRRPSWKEYNKRPKDEYIKIFPLPPVISPPRKPRKKRTEKQKKARVKEYRKRKKKRRAIPNSIITTIHMDKDLWEEFQEICTRNEGRFSASWHIWKWMKEYVRKENERALRENYWTEIKRRYEKNYGEKI